MDTSGMMYVNLYKSRPELKLANQNSVRIVKD
jgi:hypothetical protein